MVSTFRSATRPSPTFCSSSQARIKAKSHPVLSQPHSFKNGTRVGLYDGPLVPRTRHASSEAVAFSAPNFPAAAQQRVFSSAPVAFPTTLAQGYPFYPPAMLQTWAPSSQTVAFDLSSVINFNGLSPQMAYKPVASNQQPAPLVQQVPPQRLPFAPNSRTPRSSNNKNFSRPPAAVPLPLVNQMPAATTSESVDPANMANGSAEHKVAAPRPIPVSSGHTTATPAAGPTPPFPAAVFCHNRPFPATFESPADHLLAGRKQNEFVPTRSSGDSAAAAVVSTNGPNSAAQVNRNAKSKNRSKRRENDAMSTSSATSETRPKVQVKAPAFDLEAAAFPPLPGAAAAPAAATTPPTAEKTAPVPACAEANGCLADVVKGLSKSWKDNCCIGDGGEVRDKSPDHSTSQSADDGADLPPLHSVLKQTPDVSANSPSDSETDADAPPLSPSCSACCSSSKTLSYCDVARKAKQQPKDESCCSDAAPSSNPVPPAAPTTATSEYDLPPPLTHVLLLSQQRVPYRSRRTAAGMRATGRRDVTNAANGKTRGPAPDRV